MSGKKARKCTVNARVHLFERRANLPAHEERRYTDAARLDAAIAANL